MKKIVKRITVTIMCLIFLIDVRTLDLYSASSNSYALLSWYLIDSGKHLDWDGTTNYMKEWYAAVNTWNAYKAGVIRVDALNNIQDVKIMDKSSKDGSTFATTYATGQIVFYQDTMDTATSTQRQATITHEIGHALGIDHNNIANSIMRQGYKNFTALHEQDKKAYDASYKRIN